MARFGIGQAVRRVEDERFLKGAGSYVGDIALPGELFGVVVYSTQARARIKRVDASKAEAAPGVALVLTGADAISDNIGALAPAAMPEDIGGPKGYRTYRPVLCADEVRCVGDRLAFVVAETEADARDAAELIEIDYETLPAVVSLEDAVKPGAPAVWSDASATRLPPTPHSPAPSTSSPSSSSTTACPPTPWRAARRSASTMPRWAATPSIPAPRTRSASA
jgi:carbon-monoxide dehydrogenase large subunit